MAAPKIAAVATATPPWRYDQATVLRMSGYDDPRRMGFFSNSLIETRHLYMDPATFTPDESVDQLNERWRRGAVEVGTAAVARAIERAGWRREDVDFLATTTCTGITCGRIGICPIGNNTICTINLECIAYNDNNSAAFTSSGGRTAAFLRRRASATSQKHSAFERSVQ